MNQFQFAYPWVLYLLFILPVLVMLFILTWRMRKKSLDLFGSSEIINQLMPDVSSGRPILKFSIIMFVLLLAVIAIARPQFGSKMQEVKRQGVELMIALDVSNSMMAEDIKPSRLEKAKQAISRLLDNLKDDKIGLIVFAGDAYIQVPITTDYSATKMFLSTIKTDYIQNQGTAIGAAIDLASRSFSPDNEKNKAIIIITDGENHEDDPVKSAQEAKTKGMIVHTIGMGLAQGAPIPVEGTADFKKDNQGTVIISKLDEEMLMKIASAGNGIYVRANNISAGLSEVYDEINKMQKHEVKTKIFAEYDDQFQYIISFALVLLLIEFSILNRKNKYLKNINLFK
jgi:Ca-activated chloride channel homolog